MDVVYLIHFDSKISPDSYSRHYVGYTNNLKKRLRLHKSGKGCKLCAVAKLRDIEFKVVGYWQGDRQLERLIKRQKNHSRFCPICNQKYNGKYILNFKIT